jgi:hypothetical protein
LSKIIHTKAMFKIKSQIVIINSQINTTYYDFQENRQAESLLEKQHTQEGCNQEKQEPRFSTHKNIYKWTKNETKTKHVAPDSSHHFPYLDKTNACATFS